MGKSFLFLDIGEMFYVVINSSGSSIQYIRKTFRKTNISHPPDRWEEMLDFREILRTY